MTFDRDWLEDEGFRGFVPFSLLPRTDVPRGAGVYVVYREDDGEPEFVHRNPAGHFKGKDPTVPLEILRSAWVPGARTLYIGKAALGASGRRGLAKRLDEYRRFGAGEPIGHWGGRYVWQLAEAASLLVAWQETPDDDPRQVERGLLADFRKRHGKRPFANLIG